MLDTGINQTYQDDEVRVAQAYVCQKPHLGLGTPTDSVQVPGSHCFEDLELHVQALIFSLYITPIDLRRGNEIKRLPSILDEIESMLKHLQSWMTDDDAQDGGRVQPRPPSLELHLRARPMRSTRERTGQFHYLPGDAATHWALAHSG